MTEVPDGTGCYNVRSVSELLEEAKSRFPIRASRGYRDVLVPSNMEKWFLLRISTKADLEAAFAIVAGHPKIKQVEYDYRETYHQNPDGEPEYPNQCALYKD